MQREKDPRPHRLMEMLVEVHGKLLGNSAVDQGRCTMSHAMTAAKILGKATSPKPNSWSCGSIESIHSNFFKTMTWSLGLTIEHLTGCWRAKD